MRSREFADGEVGAALAEALMPEPWISASTPVTSEPISQTGTCILAEPRSSASLRSFNGAGINASLTLRDASSGLLPAMSTDTCALRKERPK